MKEEVKLFKDGLTQYLVLNCAKHLDDNYFDLYANYINWDQVPDDKITNDKNIMLKLDWIKYINKFRALKIATKTNNIDYIPLERYYIEKEEAWKSIKVKPDLIPRLNINFSDLTDDEVKDLLNTANKKIINFISEEQLDLNLNEKYKIAHYYNFDENIIEKTHFIEDLEDRNYYIRELLIHTGDKYIDYINLDSLYPSDWIKILKERSELIDYVNINDFLEGDIYYLIQLCYIFPEYINYIDENNCNEISSFGWEKLLIDFSDIKKDLINLCDFDQLEDRSWRKINKHKPELMINKS